MNIEVEQRYGEGLKRKLWRFYLIGTVLRLKYYDQAIRRTKRHKVWDQIEWWNENSEVGTLKKPKEIPDWVKELAKKKVHSILVIDEN